MLVRNGSWNHKLKTHKMNKIKLYEPQEPPPPPNGSLQQGSTEHV